MDGVLRKSDIFLATFDIFQRMNMFGCPETGGIYMALWQGWGRREKEKALIRALIQRTLKRPDILGLKAYKTFPLHVVFRF